LVAEEKRLLITDQKNVGEKEKGNAYIREKGKRRKIVKRGDDLVLYGKKGAWDRKKEDPLRVKGKVFEKGIYLHGREGKKRKDFLLHSLWKTKKGAGYIAEKEKGGSFYLFLGKSRFSKKRKKKRGRPPRKGRKEGNGPAAKIRGAQKKADRKREIFSRAKSPREEGSFEPRKGKGDKHFSLVKGGLDRVVGKETNPFFKREEKKKRDSN